MIAMYHISQGTLLENTSIHLLPLFHLWGCMGVTHANLSDKYYNKQKWRVTWIETIKAEWEMLIYGRFSILTLQTQYCELSEFIHFPIGLMHTWIGTALGSWIMLFHKSTTTLGPKITHIEAQPSLFLHWNAPGPITVDKKRIKWSRTKIKTDATIYIVSSCQNQWIVLDFSGFNIVSHIWAKLETPHIQIPHQGLPVTLRQPRHPHTNKENASQVLLTLTL